MSRPSASPTAWLHRGVWRILADWFKVPQHPPDLPARTGETVERFRPAPAFLGYLLFPFWWLVAVDALLLVLWLSTFLIGVRLGLGLAPLFLLAIAAPTVLIYAAIHLRYETTWYVLTDRSLRIRRGIWTIRENTITFENVQDVSVEQGPLQRWFGIADVTVRTAGGGTGSPGPYGAAGKPRSHMAVVEGVADAPRIRDMIMARVRASRSAGLGDERPAARRPAAARLAAAADAPGWTAEHIAVLRQIRDELAAL